MNYLYKLGTPYPEDHEYRYPDAWATEQTSGGESRLIIAPAHHQIDLILKLLEAMTPPFWVLYVLVVSRGGSDAGRYQSTEPQSMEDVAILLVSFNDFLEQDGRHNLWIASTSTPHMLIYDRHNVLYGYAAIDAWKPVLAEAGLVEVSAVRFPDPHSHHYHFQFDAEERRMIRYFDWQHTSLRQSDDA